MAWLAWEEGFRRGQLSQAVDPAVEPETSAWLNHILSTMWGDRGKTSLLRQGGGDGNAGVAALGGLSSFISE